jgi:hypothetical protein
VRTELTKEIAIVLIIKLTVLLIIWRMFFYDHVPVIDPLQHLLF